MNRTTYSPCPLCEKEIAWDIHWPEMIPADDYCAKCGSDLSEVVEFVGGGDE